MSNVARCRFSFKGGPPIEGKHACLRAVAAAGKGLGPILGVVTVAHEGVGYDLGPGWFLAALTKGCTGFFGIEVGPHGIIKDEQNPDAFAAWRRKH